jgi:hypothetical protein
MSKTKNKLVKFIGELNERGIPIPLVRLNGYATFTGTMTLLSFLVVLLGSIGKVTKLIGEVDLTQAMYLFGICLGAYLGNKKIVGVLESPGKEKKDD